jgi:hypothetical protein
MRPLRTPTAAPTAAGVSESLDPTCDPSAKTAGWAPEDGLALAEWVKERNRHSRILMGKRSLDAWERRHSAELRIDPTLNAA